MIDPKATLQDFDAWHLAMMGEADHEQMCQRRLNAEFDQALDQQIEIAAAAFAPFYTGNPRPALPPMRIDADGYFAAPLTIGEGKPYDPAGFR